MAGMNVNVWDVTDADPGPDPVGARGAADRLADPAVPLEDLVSPR